MRIPTPVRFSFLGIAAVIFGGAESCSAPSQLTINNFIDNNSEANASNETSVTIEDDCCGDCCEDDCCEPDCDSDDTGDPVDTCDCPEGYIVSDDGESCILTETVDATFTGKYYDVCPGNTDAVYGKFGAKYPGGTLAQSDYWGDDDAQSDGRLNEIGVWACDAATGAAGTEPIGEWIGFSACFEIPADGDYLVGIAADNRVKFSVDGTLFFSDTTGSTSAFNYWYINPISLTAGTHIVEMEGLNDGDIAAFGAEIAGPFPAGSLVSDADMIAADYAGNIVWTTGDMQGEIFDLGEESGWACPDGYALNTCEEEPVCTFLDEIPCGAEPSDDGGGDDGGGDDGGGDDGSGDDGGGEGGGDEGGDDSTGADGTDPTD